MRAFSDAVQRQRRAELRDAALAARAAQADKRAFKAFLRAVDGPAE